MEKEAWVVIAAVIGLIAAIIEHKDAAYVREAKKQEKLTKGEKRFFIFAGILGGGFFMLLFFTSIESRDISVEFFFISIGLFMFAAYSFFTRNE